MRDSVETPGALFWAVVGSSFLVFFYATAGATFLSVSTRGTPQNRSSLLR